MRNRPLFAVALIIPCVLIGASACSDDDDESIDSIATESPDVESPSPDTNVISLVCPDPIGAVLVETDETDQWSPGHVVGSDLVLEPVAFGAITYTDAANGQTQTSSPETKPGADTTGAVECSFTDEVAEDGERGVVSGTVQVVQQK